MKRHASMNRIYRLVWNATLQSWVAVAEIAKGRGKSGGKSRTKLLAQQLVTVMLSAGVLSAHAAPIGGQITDGSASISQTGTTTSIHQNSTNVSINWSGFDIAPTETVNFIQPSASSLAVNRIYSTSGTQILGHLNANGQVWLLNPNGILFGQGAQVNVGGLVASTLTTVNSNGNTASLSGNGTGSIVNQGSLNGKYIALIGNTVSNTGTINANQGTAALGAGNAVTLTFKDASLVQMQVDQSVLNSQAQNGGLIQADGGYVVMTAGAKDALLASVVNNTGIIEARTVNNQNGVIDLMGGMAAGTVNVGGKLDASAPNGGNGGKIETSAHTVQIAPDAKITTQATNGLTGSWLIDPADFTIAATGGNETGAQLSSALAGSNVTIQSSSGNTGTAGNINVNDTVGWSANTLTLNADNNININSPMNGSGTAGLALQYGQGSPTGVIGTTAATYNVNAPVNLAATGSFSTQSGSTGATVPYTIIDSLGTESDAASAPATMSLQGLAATSNLAGNYVLGANIDASPTSTWNSSAGFTPIGNSTTPFTGTFDGLGHTINNLTIHMPSSSYVGLFGSTANGMIRNVGMLGGSVIAANYAGSLVGNNNGKINNSYATGSMTGGVMGSYNLGGLVGNNNGTISNSYATGVVTGSGNYIGGLVGYNAAPINHSYATGNVAGGNDVGGLTGYNGGPVNNSYATGNVTGGLYNVGGLVGYNNGTIGNSFATGSVTGENDVGGLAGQNSSHAISNSYATGSVEGERFVGGLVGYNDGSPISNSYATGNVKGNVYYVGGLAGYNAGPINDSYAMGSVTGGNNVGGLVGINFGPISNSYAKSSVTGDTIVGGLVGNNGGTISNAYWDNSLVGTENGGAVNSYTTVKVTGSANVGGLAGVNVGTINNSHVTGSVLSDVAGSYNVGGLAGYNNGPISNSYVQGSVTGSGNNVGGLVGGNNNGLISNSYATASVSGSNDVGGLVGVNISGPISNSYSAGNVIGGYYDIGGLVGNNNQGPISSSYATGRVTGGTNVGGLVGYNGGSLTNAYWNNSVNSTGIGGGTTTGATGLSSTQMQMASSFTGFDFTSVPVWGFQSGVNNNNPILCVFGGCVSGGN